MKINKIYKVFTLTSLLFFCFCNVSIAQTKGTKLKATVVDVQGLPLNAVTVFVSNGNKATTDVNGKFQIKLLGDGTISLQKKGFISKTVDVSNIDAAIVLEKTPFLTSKEDEIKMGVVTKHRRDVNGAISIINTKDRLTYDNTQFVRNYINGLMLGVRGSENIRGIGNAVFVIDGVIGRDPNILNMEEVDQIAVLKDANAVALYGSQARNGVIVINTKRGKVNRKEVNVNVLSGFNTPVSLPNYLGSAEYMEFYNEALQNDNGVGGVPFGQDVISNTRNGLNPYQFPDVDYYSTQFVEPFTTYTNVITEFSGGNEKNQYYVNVGFNRNSAWVDINDDINAGTNRFNIRGNIDFKINDWITSSLDGIAIVSTSKSSRANLLDAATTIKPNNYSPFLPLNLIDTSNPTVAGQLQSARTFNGMLLGTSQEFKENAPVALAIAGGYENTVFRSTQFNNTINFDLGKVAKGLSAKTYLSFDFYDSYDLSIENEFKTYAPEWLGNQINNFGIDNTDPANPIADNSRIFGEDRKDQTENVSTNGFISRFGFYGLINYEKTIAENHSLNTSLLAFYNSENRNDVIQTDVDSHIGFQMSYAYKRKLFVDFSGAYVTSIKLPEGNRGSLSPTASLGYVLSEEPFLKDNNFINYLKIKVSGGIIKSDQGIVADDSDDSDYYLYASNYSRVGSFNWADGRTNNRLGLSQGANPNLGFEERIDLNIGFETYLMNSLWIEANYFKTELDKQVSFLEDKYPSFYSAFRPYDNFNKNLYTGFELGINFTKTYQDLSISAGANVLYSQTEALKRVELNEFSYQNRVGNELSSILGLQDQGFYQEADFDIDTEGNYTLKSGSPVPNFGNVQPGDIKYKDQNNDNIIDNDDRLFIGQSSSPWSYGVNLNVKYKAFNFFVLGTGQTGALGNKLNSSFNNYYAVNGNVKYSEVVRDRWTPSTANTASFPRLSTQTNQNNFRTSTFWLYDNSFFNINRAQLTYELDRTFCKNLGIEDFSINISGTNLLEISENRAIRQLRIGSNPLTRSYTLGLRVAF
ncbi:SusC/RagA family TonB-linked outer membrane protein [uncultured Polaribacter sp.]|uniref:SusC/RagA family TonB-linked outer membrane protein n=1 Tax=uncultured Polaribacter sp. TaxID=174711 RepID=UPI0026053F11|nr:SusC/RagA family TonB-linked outer membrane protein [uncultured Polaribacter sp.]